jgi:hypothetical protein
MTLFGCHPGGDVGAHNLRLNWTDQAQIGISS